MPIESVEVFGASRLVWWCVYCPLPRNRIDGAVVPVFLRREKVDLGSGQSRRAFDTDGLAVPTQACAAALRRGFQEHANAGLGRKMPIPDEVFL
jgi:hypothetical protein